MTSSVPRFRPGALGVGLLSDPLGWPLDGTAEPTTGFAVAEELEAPLLRAVSFASDAATRLAIAGRLTADGGTALVAWTAAVTGAAEDDARGHLFLRALLGILSAGVAPGVALDGVLATLVALGQAAGARLESAGEPVRPPVGDDVGDEALEVPIEGSDAVLRARSRPGAEACCRAFVEEAAQPVRVLLGSSPRRGAADAAKLGAAERRLRRLALDLHDGPAQDVAALAADAALLEAELRSPRGTGDVLGLASEIRERLSALGREIRDLAEVLEPRSILRESLPDVLAREAAAFARRTGIAPELTADDEIGVITASQQIALVRVVQEALANVRAHAGATAVEISVRPVARGVRVSVADDGRGFDPRRVARRASAKGGLGLAGMEERVRLLGGTLSIESRPGGPTLVEATIPRWRPS